MTQHGRAAHHDLPGFDIQYESLSIITERHLDKAKFSNLRRLMFKLAWNPLSALNPNFVNSVPISRQQIEAFFGHKSAKIRDYGRVHVGQTQMYQAPLPWHFQALDIRQSWLHIGS